MKTKDLETMLKKMDPGFRIVDNSQFGVTDVVGVYWNDVHLCACPANDVLPERSKLYVDAFGKEHRSLPEVIAICEGFYKEISEDKETYDLMMEKI